ncbi:MAG: methyltransferase domain-containing protein [Bacteroidetes bacterium]|nr:MAG: methyltransferase domain-containing protein [Bacteroidota bacterium]
MNKLDQDYWDSRYTEQQTGWDIGTVSPPLAQYIDQLSDKSIRILIPGCGNAYEAQYLLDHGFENISVVDISPTLTAKLSERWKDNPRIQVLCTDFFKLNETYDLILEQTFFCAIDPTLREAYAQKTAELLKSGGKLVGILFDRSFPHEGPPFGGNAADYRLLLQKYFSDVQLSPCHNSIEPRQGSEAFLRAKK